MNETIDFIELKQYHLEIFLNLFGDTENLRQIFNNLWKNHLQAEVVEKLLKERSKYLMTKGLSDAGG